MEFNEERYEKYELISRMILEYGDIQLNRGMDTYRDIDKALNASKPANDLFVDICRKLRELL